MGEPGQAGLSSQAGATGRCVEALKELLAAQTGMEPPA
jgi:hypothetical protein